MYIKRMVRRVGWSRNPLRRRSDRVEAWFTLVLVAIMLVLGPWAASRAANASYRDEIRKTAWEMEHRSQVDAMLLEDARQDTADAGGSAAESVPTIAQWTGPGSTVHAGMIYADAGTRAGTTVRLWIDEQGLASSPPGLRNPRGDAAMAAVLTLLGIACGLAGIRRIVRWQLDRRRMRAWQLEWMTVGPGWTRQR
jgi:hypothetical protein